LFINVEELFKSLKIPCSNVLEGTSLEGSIGNGRESYSISFAKELIKVGNQINVQDKLLMESGSLYMESSFCGYFGIRLDFTTDQ
jgi:hypothetical protein